MSGALVTVCTLSAALLQSPSPPPPSATRLTRFLQQSIGLDAAQLAAVERGEAVVKVLETRDRRDVAVFGITTLRVARDVFVQQLRDFPTSLRAPSRTQLGIFGNPATRDDVAALTISGRDAAEMKDCHPGDCVVKLPAADMRRIREQTNWLAPAPDLQAQLSAYARRRLVDYVSDYRARGDSAMAIYDDRGNLNVRASEAFAAQLAESPYVYQNLPSLQQYLTTYPRGSLPGAVEIVFWSEDVLPRLRPILSVTHLIVYSPPELPGMTLMAAKQIYANHYFETALELTSVLDRPAQDNVAAPAAAAPAPPAGTYLLVLRRYRFDNLPGGILNIRGKAIGALRDQLLTDLRRR